MMPKVSLVIPAYNAETTIAHRIAELREELKNAEIIVVCNGCTDDTANLARNLKGVKVLEFPEKLGKGGAVAEGLKSASHEYAGFIDADMSFAAQDLKKMIAKLSVCDCVIASKWKETGFNNVKEGAKRKLYGRIWNFMVNLLFGLGVSDSQAGMKIFKKSFLPVNFVTKGFEFDVELLYKIRKNGGKILEYGVAVRKGAKTTMRRSDMATMFFNLIKLKALC